MMRAFIRLFVFLKFLSLAVTGSALEFLTDAELEKLDGYTSPTLTKEYDDDGGIAFVRQDVQDCYYDQNENTGESNAKCERQFENENDRIQSENFERFLLASELLIEDPPQFDDLSDNLVRTRLTGFSEDRDADVPFCDVGEKPGVMLLEDIIVQNFQGGALVIDPIDLTTQREIINGREVNMIVINTPALDGVVGLSNIRVGTTTETAPNAPSLGGIFTNSYSATTTNIYRSID